MSIWTLTELLSGEEKLKFVKLVGEETEELTKRKIKKLLEQDFQLDRMGNLHSAIKKKIEYNNFEIKDRSALESNTKYLFITISFRQDIGVDSINRFHHKFVKKGCFHKCLGVLEQRGTVEEDNIGKGLHAHYLVHRNYKYKVSQLKRNVKDSAKKFVGNVNNENFIHFKYCCEEFAKDKQDYIINEKYGDTKDKKQEGDKIFREKKGIEKYLGEIIF